GVFMTKYVSISSAHKRGKDTLPVRFKNIFNELKIEPAPVFKTFIPQANKLAEAVDLTETPRSFKQKYGTSKSGDRYIYEYIFELTEEFLRYVK
ncbi:MAG: hypothetical protein ACYDEE_00005, partial [Ignavibacteriaceae bacterium]